MENSRSNATSRSSAAMQQEDPYDILVRENRELKNRIVDLEERLKKYTNSDGHRRYYEKNKGKIIEKANAYLKRLAEENPDKLKEYRRKAYMKRKVVVRGANVGEGQRVSTAKGSEEEQEQM